MGGGGGQPVEIPDYKIYSNKADKIPELAKHQQRLAALGLKDPWIRNEVWKFQPSAGYLPFWQRMRITMFRGFGTAAVAVALTVVVKSALSKDDHGHH